MNRQRGIALVTAILVVSLAAIAAAAILSSSNIAMHRASNLLDTERAWWYADGVESWVKSILERDLDDNKIDTLDDAWAKPVDNLPVDQGHVKGAVIDLQGRFNVNTLAATDAKRAQDAAAIFGRLLEQVDEDMDDFRAKALTAAIKDWVDKDSEPTGMDGAEDTEYIGMQPIAYRVPNRPLESVSELLAVKGMTRELYVKLTRCASLNNTEQGCVAALPATDTTINVNTAPEPVLRALVQHPTAEFEKFVEERVEKPAETVAALTSGHIIGAADAQNSALDVKSSYFMLRGEAVIGAGRVTLFSTYYRPPSSGKAVVLGRSTDAE